MSVPRLRAQGLRGFHKTWWYSTHPFGSPVMKCWCNLEKACTAECAAFNPQLVEGSEKDFEVSCGALPEEQNVIGVLYARDQGLNGPPKTGEGD